jgi:acyl-coenzyme A synthetase/AMP-(fatty) acid ligase
LSSTVQYIAWYAHHAGDATAIIEADRQVSYRALAADVARCAQALDQAWVRPGMLVGIETANRTLHLLLLLACEVIGAATISLAEADLTPSDSLFPHCDVVLSSSSTEASGESPRVIVIPPDWASRLARQMPADPDLAALERPERPEFLARIVRTSGSTGRPKAMPLSSTVQQLRIVRGLDRVAQDLLPPVRFLCLYRLAVGGICIRVLGTLQQGGTVVFAVEQQVTGLIASGAINYLILAVGDTERIIRDAVPPPAGHVFKLELFGAAVSPRFRQSIRERTHALVATRYSSNETNPVSITDDDNVGTLCPGVEVRIVDRAGNDLPLGQAGAIRVRSETMVPCYFNDAALTASSFFDGWFQTGDVGLMPARGKLLVLGRSDDMLNIGGIKVARLPLEAEVKQIDGISDTAALAIASENDVTLLLVAVEIAADTLSASLSRAISAVVSRHVRTFEIMPLPWFPRSASGKVQRPEIEAAFRRRQSGEVPLA